MKIQPLFDCVVVKPLKAEVVTQSGIVLAEQAEEKPQTATVVAVGKGGIIDGNNIEMQVKIGDKVLFPKYSGSEFKIDGETLLILKQNDILAILIED